MAAPKVAVTWHELQAQSNWCVPASTCICARARGTTFAQDALAASWSGSGRGFALEDAAQTLGATFLRLDPTDQRFLRAFRAYLDGGSAVIVQVFASTIDAIARAKTPAPSSPYGRLCVHPHGQLHAVVLVGTHARGFLYLDPYFDRTGQPYLIENDDLVRAFQGDIVIV
jgi:hypothetical protein